MKKKAETRGRPSKLTDEVQARIVQALSGGNFRQVAASWAGVDARTLRVWMAAGRADPTSRHGIFVRAVVEAEKAAEIRAVALIMKAASEDAKHAQWWLSHRHPGRWAEKRRLEVDADGPVTVSVAINGITPKEKP